MLWTMFNASDICCGAGKLSEPRQIRAGMGHKGVSSYKRYRYSPYSAWLDSFWPVNKSYTVNCQTDWPWTISSSQKAKNHG
jgi:hypothetical protein